MKNLTMHLLNLMLNCKQCQKPFEVTSKNPHKQFCSVKCFAQSDQFKAGQLKKRTGDFKKCAHCGDEFYAIKSYAHRKYCSMACYKKYKAAVFDQFIYTTDDINSFNNFDEFMVKAELHCPFKGCDWQGKHLGQHVCKQHDIKADTFKKLVGFNITEGLITLELKEQLKHTTTPLAAGALALGRKAERTKPTYVSKQSIESRQKVAALTKTAPDRHCKCCQCGVEFIGNWAQSNRYKKGMNVSCSLKCKQTFVSNQRR